MGIDTAAMLIVGLRRGDMEITETLEELIQDGGLDRCPTYYDGYGDDSEVIGYSVKTSGDYSAAEVTLDLEKIESLKKEFGVVTGYDAKLWVAPYVS